MSLRFHLFLLPLLSSFLEPVLAEDAVNYNVTGFDVAPDWSKDPLPPYPPVTDDKGKLIDVKNLRGTRLFGWQGCTDVADIIKEAYNDFYKLSHLDGLWKNFDWDGKAAKDMWGAPTKIPNERREEIRQIYDAAKEIWYSNWQRPPWSPPIPGRDLWIKVTCSGGDNSGDPEDVCGDKPDSKPECPPPKKGKEPAPGKKKDMEAYSNPRESYSRITFCKKFFNDLKSLDDVTKDVKKQRPEVQDHLDQWNNRARCFFHEITHLDYFMNAPAKSPYIEDALITYKTAQGTVEEGAYGPYNVKVLRNYAGDAWYTGQNADTFAWYAMAMWAKKEIGRYPPLPAAGSKKPTKAPRRHDGSPFNAAPASEGQPEDLGDQEIDNEPVEGFTIPGCGDKQDVEDKQVPAVDADCSNDASKIPSKVFSSDSNKVYKDFCNATVNNHQTLHWTADVKGNLKNTPPQQRMLLKRLRGLLSSRDGTPEDFKDFQFKLDWEPKNPFNPDDCYLDCGTAFSELSKTASCSQKGDSKDLMAKSGKIQAGCGAFGYTIEGGKDENPESTASRPPASSSTPTPSPQPDPPKKTKAISIVFQNYIDEASNENSWLFFKSEPGVSKLCERDDKALLKSKAKDDPGLYENPGYPGGTYELKIDGTNCKYMNDGSNVGALWCDGRKEQIDCREDKENGGKAKDCDKGLWAISQHPGVMCEW